MKKVIIGILSIFFVGLSKCASTDPYYNNITHEIDIKNVPMRIEGNPGPPCTVTIYGDNNNIWIFKDKGLNGCYVVHVTVEEPGYIKESQ